MSLVLCYLDTRLWSTKSLELFDLPGRNPSQALVM